MTTHCTHYFLRLPGYGFVQAGAATRTLFFPGSFCVREANPDFPTVRAAASIDTFNVREAFMVDPKTV